MYTTSRADSDLKLMRLIILISFVNLIYLCLYVQGFIMGLSMIHHWSNWLSTLWGGGNQGCTRQPSSHQSRESFGATFSKPASDTGAGKSILRWKMREIKSTRVLKKLARSSNHKRVSAPSKSFHVGEIGTEYSNSRALLVIGFKEPW